MKRKVNRIVFAFLLAVIIVSLLGGVALAYLYRAPVSITENASTSYDMLPVLWNQNNTWLAANDFMSSTANDTRIQTLGGLNKPWMVADNKTLTAIPVPADSQTNLYFVTGESAASAMDIITGYGGYYTISDFNMGTDNFTWEWDGYFDAAATGNISHKQNAYRVYTDGAGTVNATIGLVDDYTTPTSHNDYSGAWSSEANAYDNDTGTYAYSGIIGAGGWTSYLGLIYTDEILVRGVRFWYSASNANANTVEIDAYYGGGWNNEYSTAAVAKGAWVTANFSSELSITTIRIRMQNNGAGTQTLWLNELDFLNYEATVSASGISSGEHTITVWADSADFGIDVDAITEDSVALGGSAVPDYANDITESTGNVSPWLNYVKKWVGGSLVAHYEPNAIINGTTLPDRSEESNDAIITWGSNPAGVVVTLGSMTSSGQPSIGSTTTTSTSDILPVVGGRDYNQDPDISGTLATNPLRPIVTTVSDNTTLSERQVWVWLGGIFVVFILVLVGANVRGHHLVTGIATSAAIILMVVWTVFPLWALIAVALAIWGGLVSERSPSL